MATAKFIVNTHHFKADGTTNVKLMIYHKGRKKYIQTSVFLTKAQLTKGGKIKDYNITEQLDKRLIEIRSAISKIDGIDFLDVENVTAELLKILEGGNAFKLDFFGYSDGKIKLMEIGTASIYKTSLNALERYVCNRVLDVNDIDTIFVNGFRTFLENEPKKNRQGTTETKKGCRSVSSYLSCLRHLHNLARQEFNDEDGGIINIPRRPFKGRSIPPQPQTEHRVLTAEQLLAIYRSDVTLGGRRAVLARDCFLLSFALVGINSVDLYNLKKTDVSTDGFITYERAKTDSRRNDRGKIVIKIEPEILPILDKYKAISGKYFFRFSAMYSTHATFNTAINQGLKKVAKFAGINDNLQFYHARHSWATIARNDCGIPFSDIHEALCHAVTTSERVTDIYIKKDFSRTWKANRQVLDYVFQNG